MASSSSNSSTAAAAAHDAVTFTGTECFYCLCPSDQFRRGWKLRNGNYAGLCNSCADAYEGGWFCKVFHWSCDGWRSCAVCRKLIHCGCIMSSHTYLILDAGGVKCMECLKNDCIKKTMNQQAKASSGAAAAPSKN